VHDIITIIANIFGMNQLRVLKTLVRQELATLSKEVLSYHLNFNLVKSTVFHFSHFISKLGKTFAWLALIKWQSLAC
jgi:hypothetical protein